MWFSLLAGGRLCSPSYNHPLTSDVAPDIRSDLAPDWRSLISSDLEPDCTFNADSSWSSLEYDLYLESRTLVSCALEPGCRSLLSPDVNPDCWIWSRILSGPHSCGGERCFFWCYFRKYNRFHDHDVNEFHWVQLLEIRVFLTLHQTEYF